MAGYMTRTARPRAAVRSVWVDGRAVRWRVAGKGPALVLVHGLGGSWRWWDAVLGPLAGRFTCHLVDVPRFGAALRPDGVAEWLAEWAEGAELGPARVVGHSLGGAAAARWAALQPDAVEALVLAAPAGVPSGRRLTGYMLPLATAVRDSRHRFVPRMILDALRAGPGGLLRGGLYAARADVREQVRGVRAPTLLVWGDRDPLVPFALAEEWRRTLPDARLVVLNGVGHVPMVDRPAAFARALVKFLDEPGHLPGRVPVRGVRGAPQYDEPPAR
jgi:pimeloyl-ACP methyl ester carboxylesterase